MELQFERIKLDSGTFEAASAMDIDGDGVLDIVCGGYWYKGPDFRQKIKMCDVMPEGEYFDDFSDYGMDVNGDGRVDVITGGWFGQTLRWRENPGDDGLWKVHDIDHCGSIETTRFLDIDGCGTVEVFPNTPGEPQAFYKLIKDDAGHGTGRFEKFVISQGPSGHGMGFGDIDSDGLIEIILCNGYLHQLGSVFEPWEFKHCFDQPMASVPMLVHDVDGDGRMDIIAANAHNYGLYWLQQQPDGTFVKHDVDTANAQYHDMQLVDIDGDGEVELVTGKRYRAHCGNDPGDNDPVQTCYFKIRNGAFEKHVVDAGPAEEHSGVGIYFWLADLDGNGYLDIVAPGKEGLYLFRNLGPQ